MLHMPRICHVQVEVLIQFSASEHMIPHFLKTSLVFIHLFNTKLKLHNLFRVYTLLKVVLSAVFSTMTSDGSGFVTHKIGSVLF